MSRLLQYYYYYNNYYYYYLKKIEKQEGREYTTYYDRAANQSS